jgi:trehalose synthase
MLEVGVRPHDLSRFDGLIPLDQSAEVAAVASQAREVIGSRRIWNVNSTPSGGGVAEMLEVLVAYARGAGVDARWLVIEGSPEFFAVTKRLHNRIHGMPGDGGDLGPKEHTVYEQSMCSNGASLREYVTPGDVVILHDPQTAGLVSEVLGIGAIAIWRSHIGTDTRSVLVDEAWEFLRPYLEGADAFVFTKASFAPPWIDRSRAKVILPSIDPFSPKNQDIHPDAVRGILSVLGIVADGRARTSASFRRRDGTTGVVSFPATIVSENRPIGFGRPMVTQISRWDRLKDMEGVLRGFVEEVKVPEARLVLAGPDVGGVADDPEAAEVLAGCVDAWEELSAPDRRRVMLVTLPMHDVDANAAAVNAIQRHARIVVQKSLMEGFGLTVTEAMWKARAVVASAVGGIPEQITDGEEGLLLEDPTNARDMGIAVTTLLEHPRLARRLGAAARQKVVRDLLGPRALVDYAELIMHLLEKAG